MTRVEHPAPTDRESLMEGLNCGLQLIIQRRDDPIVPVVLAAERDGLVTTEIQQLDEQSSRMIVHSVEWQARAKKILDRHK